MAQALETGEPIRYTPRLRPRRGVHLRWGWVAQMVRAEDS